jgi:hypothetical protein
MEGAVAMPGITPPQGMVLNVDEPLLDATTISPCS